MSKAYSRSSQYDSRRPPDPQLFAVARLKPLTPMQLATSLKIAADRPGRRSTGRSRRSSRRRSSSWRARPAGSPALIAQPTDNFQIGVGEALLFSNGDRVMKEFLTDGGGTLLGRREGDEGARRRRSSSW